MSKEPCIYFGTLFTHFIHNHTFAHDKQISVYMDLAFWLSFVMVCLVGLPIQAAIVHYDWYGGDQQKRSLGNRIVSMGTISNLLSSISALIFPIFVRSEYNSPFDYSTPYPDQNQHPPLPQCSFQIWRTFTST